MQVRLFREVENKLKQTETLREICSKTKKLNSGNTPAFLASRSDMEAATSTLHQSFGFGPRGPNPPHGAQQAQGSHSGPSAAPRPEEQQQQQQQPQTHHKPFFYIQPSQPAPYLPMQSLQWPMPLTMPMSYNPFYAYPGLGYGMPVMPHFQPNSYMEPPSFVVPHTNLHLVDYRRILNPQYYQTMAYHSRRLRYQHNGPNREMTSSEVQTEPLSATQRTSTPGSSNIEASDSVSVRRSDNNLSVHAQKPLSPTLVVQNRDKSVVLQDSVPASTARTPPNSSFVIQTEEVRIECCTTPVGLQLLHSRETAEMSHSFSQDIVQRSSVLQGCILQEKSADESEQAPQACPDILLVGTGNNQKIPALEESGNQTDSAAASLEVEVPGKGDRGKDLNGTSKNVEFKVVHLPFESEYLDELRRMESTVWSMEDTLIPSPESGGCTKSQSESLVPSEDILTAREEYADASVPVVEMSPAEENDLQDMVPTSAVHGSDSDMYPRMDVPVAVEAPVTHRDAVTHVPYLLLLDNSSPKAERSQLRREANIQDHQDTSFESLPAYLPSASWLADFDNVYYCSKMPPTPKKQTRPLSNQVSDVPSRRRKLDMEYKDHPTARKAKERFKPKGKVDRRSLSDHECCLSRNFSENAFTPYASKRERLCSRCLSKRRICMSPSPGVEGRTLKRKATPFQQWNDALLPTCEACKSHPKNQLMRKGSCHEIRGFHDTEGESSENSSSRTATKWRPDNQRKLNELKRPLTSKQNIDKCPAALYPKLREKNCACNETQHQPETWERLRHCPHGNAIRETDENCAVPLSPQGKWRNMNQSYLVHRWHNEKSWKEVMPNINGSNIGSQHFKHKKSQPQSQETRRKDTRC